MSIDAVTPLRQRMIEDMNARKLCAQTRRGHIHSCKRFAEFLKRSPDTATAEDIRRFQLHLSETGTSICNRNRIMTGVKFLLRVTLRRLDLAAEIYHIREPQKIPQVMSPDETRRVLSVATSLKARVALSLCYGCGLRAGEVVRLKVKHIDSAQRIIRIPTRWNSFRPSSCSSAPICRESAGWAMRSCAAALDTVPRSAMVTKVSAWRRFMDTYLCRFSIAE